MVVQASQIHQATHINVDIVSIFQAKEGFTFLCMDFKTINWVTELSIRVKEEGESLEGLIPIHRYIGRT